MISLAFLAGLLALDPTLEVTSTVDPKIFDVPTVAVFTRDNRADQDWWLLTTTGGPHRAVLYIDANTLVGGDGSKLVWLERVYETESEYGAKRSRSRVEVDCQAKLIGARELRSINTEGALLPKYTAIIGKAEMTPVPPGTAYSNVLAFVCDGKRNFDHLSLDKTPLTDSPEVFRVLDQRKK